ncbi:hypothetical protein [Ideonella sp.]|jgi:hypothetical protein|uniref:hypothetical protein n=1 Tax=Ideonella sp. TaxID=1929293 RepID=UPI0037BFCAD0
MPFTEAAERGLSLRHGVAWVALLAAVVALAVWWPTAPDEVPEVQTAHPPAAEQAISVAASSAQAPVPTAGIKAVPAAAPASGPSAAAAHTDLAAHVPPGQAPAMAEVIQRLNQAGVRSGLGAFNPPGTRPPLIGLAVPQDFELPPGFMRHHQATDDGQRIEAVLMFTPDHPYVLAHPDLRNRVVPPEMAPEGLPLRTITLPAPRSHQP